MYRQDPINIEYALHKTSKTHRFPPANDRNAWEKICMTLGEEEIKQHLSAAENAAVEDIPEIRATEYLTAKRTGEYEQFGRFWRKRRKMLCDLTLGECLEGKGRFLDPLLDIAWAICEESSWVQSGYQIELADMQKPVVDLSATETGLALSEMAALLEESIDPALYKRIAYEVDRRLFVPYTTSHDFWWLFNCPTRELNPVVNNWTAVCNAGIIGAALYMEKDQARQAEMVSRAVQSVYDYLETFDVDGGSEEGPAYWNYGFGHYVILADFIHHFTGGAVDLMEGDRIRKIARFPLRTVLSPGFYANFSDADARAVYSKPLLVYLAKRLGMVEFNQLAGYQGKHDNPNELFHWRLRSLFWRLPEDMLNSPPPTPSRHDWFGGNMWMFARYSPDDPDGLVLAAKGGHNGESHNHNDLGNFIIHFYGESLVAEVGRPRYTRQTFSEQRFAGFVGSSQGHSVPVVNGFFQHHGSAYRAELLKHESNMAEDELRLELNKAYPDECGILSLQRTLKLHRTPPHGWVEVQDDFVFPETGGSFESVLTTFCEVELKPDEGKLIIRGVRSSLEVVFDPKLVLCRLEQHKNIDLAEGYRDVNRVVLAYQEKAQRGTLCLKFYPVAGNID